LQALNWAVENDSYIVEDEFRFDASPPSSLAGLDRSDRVIYVGIFSKTLVPALRLGYLIAPEHLVERLIDLKWWTDRGGPAIDQMTLVDWMDSGFLIGTSTGCAKYMPSGRQWSMSLNRFLEIEVLPEFGPAGAGIFRG
jgi:DNA-binding transcriptional MocR family regulator